MRKVGLKGTRDLKETLSIANQDPGPRLDFLAPIASSSRDAPPSSISTKSNSLAPESPDSETGSDPQLHKVTSNSFFQLGSGRPTG